jgi:hypothetical protein
MTPGSNILQTALSVIARSPFAYYAFSGRTANDIGQYQATYNPPLNCCGSVQAVPRNLYNFYGLEFQKYYLKFFCSRDAVDVGRDTSGDMIVYSGNNYQVLSITPWYDIDGWVEILAVQVPNSPTVT